MTTGDLIIYRTRRKGARLAVFVAFVGGKALIRIGGVVRCVHRGCLEAI